jgi:hypothetical protein
MVLPNVAFLLKAIRFMCNYIVQTRNQGVVSVSKISMDHALGKGFHEYLGTIFFSLPSSDTIKSYEKMKKEWNDKHLLMDINYIDMLDRPDENQLLRQKNLELTVKLKEKRLANINNENKPKETDSYYETNV